MHTARLSVIVLCPAGKHLQNLHDKAHRVGLQALAALKMAPTHKRKTDALDKAVLAQMAHDELISHLTSCKTCSGTSELARLGDALGDSESRQTLEHAIDVGRGSVYLRLTPSSIAN
jgi:hypothetical protein